MKRRTIYDVLILFVVLLAFLGFLFHAAAVREAVAASLALVGRVLVPSLFPCMVLSTLFIETGAAARLGRRAEGVMQRLFRLPGESAVPLLLGLAAGYPIGAQNALALHAAGRLGDEETERLLSFTNNSGPAFIFGAVGISLFSSGKAGLLLFVSHVLATLLVGMLSRLWEKGGSHAAKREARAEVPPVPFAAAFTAAVKGSALAILHIAAYVVFFSAAVRVLIESGALPRLADGVAAVTGMPAADAENLLAGLIEMVGGLSRIAEEGGALPRKIAMAAFLLGWAGMSVHSQVMSFLGEKKLSLVPYFLGKLLHGLVSAGVALLLVRLFPFSAPVSLSESFSGALLLPPGTLALWSLLTGGALWLGAAVREKRL